MQAARGTSLSRSDSDPTTPPLARGRAVVIFGCVAAVLYALDQVTKVLAADRLADGADRPLVGDLLQLHLARNPGAAFSTGTAYTQLFSCVAIAAVLVILYLSRRLRSALWAVAFGFLLAGVAGNLTDRLVRAPGPLEGHVVDFLMLPHWPIFNVADICINIAAGLILLQAYRGVRMDGSRPDRSEGA